MSRLTFWPDKGQTILLHAVLDEPEKARAAVHRWLETVDFEAIDLGSQRLLPLLHARLKLLGIDHPLGPRIKGVFRRNWYLDQRLRRQLRVVRASFQAAGIDCILFKGAALGSTIYRHGAFRPADDIDILVRPEAFAHAVEVLGQTGWRREAVGWHASTFRSEFGAVDLHVSPFHEALGADAVEPLWQARRDAIIDGAPAHLLSAHDQILQTLTHGLRANIVPPVRWITDALLMIRQDGEQTEWNIFTRRAEQLGFTLVASRGLRYLVDEFAAPVPDGVLERLAAWPKRLRERIEFHCGREDRFPPLAKLALTYRQGPPTGRLARLRRVAREYRDDWRSPDTVRFIAHVLVRLVLGRSLTARIYPRSPPQADAPLTGSPVSLGPVEEGRAGRGES